MTKDVMKWLQEVRKLDGALLAMMRVKAISHDKIEGPAVAFPYIRKGEVYAGKARGITKVKSNGAQNFAATPGVSRGLYNEDALNDGDGPIVITEGEMDCIAVIQAGFMRAVSVPDGWSKNGGKRDCLVKEDARLRKSPFVIVAGDNDEAGAGLPKAVQNILAGHDVRYVVWPDGCKDANDVLMLFGEGELAKCLLNAKRIDPPGGFITGISDLPPMPARRVLRVGMKPYDLALAFEVGAMSVGTGTPGSGKSTFTTFCAYHVAKSEEIRVGMLAFETHPHRIRDHLCRLHMGRQWTDLPEIQKDIFADWADQYFRIAHRKYDDNPEGHNLNWLHTMIYQLAVYDDCKLIIVDPWNELEHLPERGENMTAYINSALQQIRVWAEQYDTHVCLIAHPRKMPTDGTPRSPTGYDVADSAAFANKPSLGFTVHQEQDDDGMPFVRVSAWKVRDTQLYGFEKGSIRLSFDQDRMNYRQFNSLCDNGAGA